MYWQVRAYTPCLPRHRRHIATMEGTLYQKNLNPEGCDAAFSVDPKRSFTGTAGFSSPPIPEKWVQVSGLRYYSPELGRWANRNPHSDVGLDRGLNKLFTYLKNGVHRAVSPCGGWETPQIPIYRPPRPTPAKVLYCAASKLVLPIFGSIFNEMYAKAKLCGNIRRHCGGGYDGLVNGGLPSPEDIAMDLTPYITNALVNALPQFAGCLGWPTDRIEVEFKAEHEGGRIWCDVAARTVRYGLVIRPTVVVRGKSKAAGHTMWRVTHRMKKRTRYGHCGAAFCMCCN